MPGQIVKELLCKGLVTKRHATMLQEGELQQADDCIYRRFDPAVHGIAGRTEYTTGTAFSDPIKGLSFLGFNGNTDILLAYSGALLYASDFTSLTRPFTVLPILGTLQNTGTEIMNAVPYGSKYYILTSGSTPRRLGYSIPTIITTTSNTVSGTTTLTTTNTKGFKSVIVGQYVSGVGGTGTIAAGARVLSKTSDTVVVLDTAGTDGTITTVTFSNTAFLQPQYAGMIGVSGAPTVATAAGSWSTAADMGAGYYWFLYTEMLMPGEVDDINNGFIESGYITKPVVLQISDTTTQATLVTRNSTVNTALNLSNEATHWQVYMSDKQTNGTVQPDLSTFKRIGSPISITATSYTFSDVNVTQGPKNPASSSTITGYSAPTNASGGYTEHDGTSAIFTGGYKGMSVGTFGFVGSGAVTGGTLTGSETVQGIKVTVFGKDLSGGSVTLKATGKASETKTFNLSGWSNRILGGASDVWAETWTPGDFVNGTFTVEIIAFGFGSLFPGYLDGISITVYYTGTTVNRLGIPLRTVTYRSQVGTSVTDSANLPLPSATTGDTFNGSLVLNDPSDPSVIKYSLPGTADAFPKPYFLRFNLPRKNIVTNIKRVGQVLVVGLRDTIQRVNYLPTEIDTNMQSGLAQEDLASDHGIVGPHAATLFDMPSGGPVLAYVSYRGIHITDGITTKYLNVDLDWERTVDLANIDTCVLTNYQQENWLIMYYAPYGTSHGKNTRALVFNYSPDKIKEDGTFPAIGPHKVSARSATAATYTGQTYVLTGHEATGKVYVEDQGLTLPSTYTVADASNSEVPITLVPVCKTRRVYAADIGSQVREQRVYAMVSPFGSTSTIACGTTISNTTVTSSAAFGSVIAGMRVTGTGIPLDTVVKSKSNPSTIILSSAAIATGTVSLTFDSGTLGLSVSGQDINEASISFDPLYQSTTLGGLVVWHADNMKEALECTFSKVTFADLTTADLSTGMRIHYFAYMMDPMGQETHRS
jgi:hypothetical protein